MGHVIYIASSVINWGVVQLYTKQIYFPFIDKSCVLQDCRGKLLTSTTSPPAKSFNCGLQVRSNLITYISGDGTTVPRTSLTQILLAFLFVQFYGAGTVWSLLQLVSHIYGVKPTFCQNNPAQYLLWMHLHQFQCVLIPIGSTQRTKMLDVR